MSILPLVAGTSGGLAVGLLVGGFTMVPRVGPWRGQRPTAPERPALDAPPTVVVVQQQEPPAVDRISLEALAAVNPANSLTAAQLDLVARAISAARALENGGGR
jgi:hypothetical protein